jgi:hypothetical protein
MEVAAAAAAEQHREEVLAEVLAEEPGRAK